MVFLREIVDQNVLFARADEIRQLDDAVKKSQTFPPARVKIMNAWGKLVQESWASQVFSREKQAPFTLQKLIAWEEKKCGEPTGDSASSIARQIVAASFNRSHVVLVFVLRYVSVF